MVCWGLILRSIPREIVMCNGNQGRFYSQETQPVSIDWYNVIDLLQAGHMGVDFPCTVRPCRGFQINEIGYITIKSPVLHPTL
jgi:hypothetical protein